MPGEENKANHVKIVTEDIEEEYMAKASGMGQTKGVSFLSDEEEQEQRRSMTNRLLLNPS